MKCVALFFVKGDDVLTVLLKSFLTLDIILGGQKEVATLLEGKKKRISSSVLHEGYAYEMFSGAILSLRPT